MSTSAVEVIEVTPNILHADNAVDIENNKNLADNNTSEGSIQTTETTTVDAAEAPDPAIVILSSLQVPFAFSLLDLAENIFTIFFFSNRFSFTVIFLSFFALEFFGALVGTCDVMNPGLMTVILSICTEFGQCMLYIYFCDYSFPALIFYPVIASVQILEPLSAYIYDEGKSRGGQNRF